VAANQLVGNYSAMEHNACACSFGTVDSIGAAVVISGVKATFLKVDANRDAQASELVPLPRLAGGVCRAEVCGLLFERLREVSFI
jgi:hypothetical protein